MKNFLQGKKISALPALTPSLVASRQPLPALGTVQKPSSRDSGTQIEVVKEGDKVARLVITCACGERIEVECLYPAS